MQRLMKICARGALGLGAAALLWSGIPAHADPASGAASRESQPGLIAQSKAQPEKAQKPEKPYPEGDQKKALEPQQESDQSLRKGTMRGATPEATPPKSSTSRFGAGVIRKSEKPVGSE